MNKPKVLILIDWFYPAYKAGGPLRSVKNLIDRLNYCFDFYVLTSNQDLDGEILQVEKERWLERDYAHVMYLEKSRIKSKIKAVLTGDNFDLIIINGMYSFYFSILPVFFVGNKTPVVVFPRGMLSAHSISKKSVKKKVFLAVITKLPAYKRLSFIATSTQEKNDVRRYFPQAKVEFIQNLVVKPSDFIPIKKTSLTLKLLTLARVSPVKNIELALNALNHYFDGQIVYDVYGAIDDKEYYLRLKQMAEKLPDNVAVNFKGAYTGNVLALISNYHFLLTTSLGENFGHSVYEALSVGRPVIAGEDIPWNLEESQAGWNLPLNDSDFFAALEQALKMNQQQYEQMALNAWKLAVNFYKQGQIHLHRLTDFFTSLIKHNRL